jgi:hypothetical protein
VAPAQALTAGAPWDHALAWWVIDRLVPGLILTVLGGVAALLRSRFTQRRAEERHADLKAHVTATASAASMGASLPEPGPPAEEGILVSLFTHVPHPRIDLRRQQLVPPPKVDDQRPAGTPAARFNTRAGLLITLAAGTMWAAYIFTLVALISLPSALRSGNLTVIIAWLSSNFLQLVLLPVLLVGQNAQSKAADKRAEQTYDDAESILHECLQLQAHLQAQDTVLEGLIAKTGGAA